VNNYLEMKGFAERLLAATKKRGWTLSELSRKSGVPKTTIHHWTCGKVPGLTQLAKVSKTLGIPFHELCFGEPDPCLGKSDLKNVHSGIYRIHFEKIEE